MAVAHYRRRRRESPQGPMHAERKRNDLMEVSVTHRRQASWSRSFAAMATQLFDGQQKFGQAHMQPASISLSLASRPCGTRHNGAIAGTCPVWRGISGHGKPAHSRNDQNWSRVGGTWTGRRENSELIVPVPVRRLPQTLAGRQAPVSRHGPSHHWLTNGLFHAELRRHGESLSFPVTTVRSPINILPASGYLSTTTAAAVPVNPSSQQPSCSSCRFLSSVDIPTHQQHSPSAAHCAPLPHPSGQHSRCCYRNIDPPSDVP